MIICALDIGTAKVCAILADLSEQTIIGAVSSAARGVGRGVVTDIDDLTDVLTEVIAELEEKTKYRIKDVYANISGAHIESRNVQGKVVISEQRSGISADDINQAIDSAQNIGLPLERRIIHAIVQDYTVDGQGGIASPINLYARELEVNLYIITGSTQRIEEIANSITCAGLNVEEFMLSAIASGWGVLTDEEKQSGTLLLDIGKEVMDLAIFKNGVIKFAKAIPLSKLDLDKLLLSAKEALLNSGHLHPGIFLRAVITGGYASGGQLRDKIDRIEETFGVPARIGAPDHRRSGIPQLCSPAYATGLGLIQYGFVRKRQQKRTLTSVYSAFSKFTSRVKNTFSTYF